MRYLSLVLISVLTVFWVPNIFAQQLVSDPTLSNVPVVQDEGTAQSVDGVKSKADRPIHALLVTGGCCHDYNRQKEILTKGISARANVRWTVVQQGGQTTDAAIPLYNDPNWADGFDIVVHNECFADVKDPAFIDRILSAHQKGTPAILIHCAMHCYRIGDDRWFRFVGLQSPGHGPHYPFQADNVKPDHPIMEGMGDSFQVAQGELYHTIKIFDTATPLAQAKRKSDQQPQVCIWTNDYQGTRVFGTTIGHYNQTMADPKYLDMMTRGLLWAVQKDPAKDFTPSTKEMDDEIKALVAAPERKKPTSNQLPQNCCGDGNLAYKKIVTVKSEQGGNGKQNLTDGLLNTRWCASGGQVNEWVVVDLEKTADLRAIRLHWEKSEGTYQYQVEGSSDQENWKTIVDQSKNKAPGGLQTHKVQASDVRYLKITFLGANAGMWGSIWELEATEGELPELPEPTAASESSASIQDVTSPSGFQVTMFGQPPQVNYPVCLTAAATGEVFVGVDPQGSLGKEAGQGKVLRCIDTDGDGVADKINQFLAVDHPRGLIYDNDSLWVLHPPTLSVFHDTDGDGVSDKSEVLIQGISTDEVNRRGADHTTNGIRMGIDGWIYIAVGDFGFNLAVAKDGTQLSKRGGGVVRIRPDGSGMEVYAWGLRNIVDVAVDPLMNVYTRDNTNDGGGWDIRVSHILQTANYGYPSFYMNFTQEIMPPLADYGGGSGCGVMYLQDSRWPAGYSDLLLTCDWGRSEVFSHRLPKVGATFGAQQDTFLKIPRPTDIEVDASGRMYVSSWKNGGFSYSGTDVGFVAQVLPEDFVPHPVGDMRAMDIDDLLQQLNHPSDCWRRTVQAELLRRSQHDSSAMVSGLVAQAGNESLTLQVRAANVFTLGQLISPQSMAGLQELLKFPAVRPFVLRAMTDQKAMAKLCSFDQVVAALHDSEPTVQAAALIALGQIAKASEVSQVQINAAAQAVLPLAVVGSSQQSASDGTDDWRLPHPERVIPHLAVKTLVALKAIDPCLAALQSQYSAGAIWALKSMHDSRAVDGLFQKLSNSGDANLSRDIWTTLIRLYYLEGEFTKDSPRWWGTRPDTTGPYYDRQKWEQSDRILAAVQVALSQVDSQSTSPDSLATHIRSQLTRHAVKLEGLELAADAAMTESDVPIQLPKVDPDNQNQIANVAYDLVFNRAVSVKGDPTAGRQYFKSQSCLNCHSFANGQQAKGPHLVDIGKRYTRAELVESIVKPNQKIAQGFDTWAFLMADGKLKTGFVVLESAEMVTIRQNDGVSVELLQDDIEDRAKQEPSMMPEGIVDNLTPEQLADLLAYIESLH